MKTGTLLSGAMHGLLLLAVIFGTDWFAADEAEPFQITDVDFVDGTEFDAMLSTAPVVANEGPADLSEPSEGESAPSPVATPQDQLDAAEAPDVVTATAPPAPRPDLPDLAAPPPPRAIPTEAPQPSIAEIPSPDVLPDQAREPESPASTEPVQPLASQQPPEPSSRPAAPPPPEPEPEIVEKEEPKPEEPEPTVEVASQPDAPVSQAPQEAKLPVARPADKAKAAIAAAEAAKKAAEVAEAETTPAETATAPERQPAQPAAAAGGSKSVFAARVTRGERDALQLGIKRHFVYTGARDAGLVVKIAIQLDQNGKITGKPKLLDASGGSKGSQSALFRAGSRALWKAEGAGEFRKLPAAKYNSWKLIHVRFTPEAIGFAS